jgi:hypothetical protein
MEILRRLGPHEQGGATTDPVGGERPDGHETPGPFAEHGGGDVDG